MYIVCRWTFHSFLFKLETFFIIFFVLQYDMAISKYISIHMTYPRSQIVCLFHAAMLKCAHKVHNDFSLYMYVHCTQFLSCNNHVTGCRSNILFVVSSSLSFHVFSQSYLIHYFRRLNATQKSLVSRVFSFWYIGTHRKPKKHSKTTTTK